MAPQYTALAQDATDNERELEAAFESDDEEETTSESTPLARRNSPATAAVTAPIDAGYDFERERDYADYAPPGSPTRAMPGNLLGNSNGVVPTPVPYIPPRQSLFSRARTAVGGILGPQYSRLSTDNRPRGGGIENDGVFANVSAKPQRARTAVTEQGEIEIVPEDTQKEAPPSYAAAQQDSVPPYWETTVHAPGGIHGEPSADGMIIDDLPTGSFLIFAFNLITSFFFQYLGFLVTYLLHTTHAAKYGSRVGLGLTLIQFGLFSRAESDLESEVYDPATNTWVTKVPEPALDISDPFSDIGISGNTTSTSTVTISALNNAVYGKEWISFLLMTIGKQTNPFRSRFNLSLIAAHRLGWFLILTSVLGYWRVKRWENSILHASRNPPTPAEHERDIALRRNIASVFGIPIEEYDEHSAQGASGEMRTDERGRVVVIPTAEALQEERLTRDLRAAGLL